MTGRVLTMDEAAAELRICKRLLREHVRHGEIPCIRMGRRGSKILFDRQDIAKFMTPAPEALDFDRIRIERKEIRIRSNNYLGREGFVYFIRRGDYVKIGFSQAPKERLAQLRISTPGHIELLGSFRGTMRDERTLHLKYEHLRRRGEWFVWAVGLQAEIEQLVGRRAAS